MFHGRLVVLDELEELGRVELRVSIIVVLREHRTANQSADMLSGAQDGQSER